jgi:hypothetical protein
VNAREAKEAAREWVAANRGDWPGLVAAHLVGGITSLPDDAPFPATKDVDLHLIVADDSPLLEQGPWGGIIAASSRGLAMEAGIKPVADYRSAAAVLANPEIAHHLLGDAVLFDPEGLLRRLLPDVRVDYARRHWVEARLSFERRGLAEAMAMLAPARAAMGASAEVNLLGYTSSFATAALCVANLEPPRMGSRSIVRLGEMLADHGRGDLHEEVLAGTGLGNLTKPRAIRLLAETAEAFDLATALPPRPRPFAHKLHRHLRPHLVDGCRAMIEEGRHREGSGWLVAAHAAATDAVLADGPEAAKPLLAARRDALLRDLKLAPDAARDAAAARLRLAYAEIFALADEIAAANPGVVDEPLTSSLVGVA